jgi:hypothetical protein
MINKILYYQLIFLTLPVVGLSQINSGNDVAQNTIGLGLDVGITSFFGDIDEGPAQGDLMNNMAFRGSVCKNFGYWFILGGQVLVGNLSGEKKRGTGEATNYQYFKTSFTEYSLNGNIDVVALFGKNKTSRFIFCIDLGAGVFTFKSKLFDGKDDSEIASYGYDGKSLMKPVIPVGAKIGYDITDHLSFVVQTSTRIVFSDLLDAKEGNNNRDFYNFSSVGFIYKIFVGSSRGRSGGSGRHARGSNIGSACSTFN